MLVVDLKINQAISPGNFHFRCLKLEYRTKTVSWSRTRSTTSSTNDRTIRTSEMFVVLSFVFWHAGFFFFFYGLTWC